MEESDGPRLIQPIPRRPFLVNLSAQSPTRENSYPSPDTPPITASDLRFLDAKLRASSSSRDLSRAASMANLTTPALFGIYSDTLTSPDQEEHEDYDDRPTQRSSLWEAGAESFKERLGLDDDDTYAVVRERSTRGRQRISYDGVGSRSASTASSSFGSASASSLAARALILFAIGVGYGALVTQVPSKQNLTAFGVKDLSTAGTQGGYLAFWGVAGVVLGALLPWFNDVWERTFGKDETPSPKTKVSNLESRWPLIVRAVGAFVGICFAIRRLPWTSTMQVSVTLALVNPFLWYFFDRSKQAFVLSTLVGLAGTAVLIGFNPDVMPAPTTLLGVVRLPANTTLVGLGTFAEEALTYVAIRGPSVVEMSMWMFSALFCSCLCFGNVGRLLAPSRSGVVQGQWRGTR